MVRFNPLSGEYARDPYPALAVLREQAPVYKSQELGYWFVTRYELCAELLRDGERFSAEPAHAGGPMRERKEAQRRLAPLGDMPILGLSDPPEHGRLRRMVNQPFTPAAADAMAPRIRAVVDEMVAALPRDEPFDFMEAFADRLPAAVMLDFLGVPRAQSREVGRWLTAVGNVRENFDLRPESVERARLAYRELRQFVHAMSKSGELPEESLLANLLGAVDDEGRPLATDELLSLVVHITLVGNGPTAGLLANGLVALLRNRDQWELLRREPGLLPQAVHELARYDAPSHAVPRVALQDTELGGRRVPARSLLFAVVGAANRDPAQFPEPDLLDIERDARTHLAFGHGPHICLGAPLARLEAQIAFETLLREAPAIELLEGEIAWSPRFELRIPDRLPVRIPR